jgi:hypothetical protein
MMAKPTEAPRVIPPELIDSFTLGGAIPILDWYINQSYAGSTPPQWSTPYLNELIANFTSNNILSGSQGRETYPGSARMLLDALTKYNIKNKKVAVIGSETPWIEAILLNMGNKVTTVEYNLPECKDKRISLYSYHDFETQEDDESFECIISYSSTEHSGLGRYGDPLDPWGDIHAMSTIYKRLDKEGILCWGGPVGIDCLVWNAHRIYGKIRLPLLFSKFIETDWFGPDKKSLLESSELKINSAQPLVVLKPSQVSAQQIAR